MKVANVVEKVVEMDQPVCPVLYRSFVQSEYSLLIVRRMNDFLQQYPEMKDIVFVVMSYPAIKWVLKNEKSSEALLRLLSDTKNAATYQAKTVAEKVAEISLDELIERRKSYIENCHVLAAGIEDTINRIGTYPDHGKKYQSVLRVALGIDEENKKELSRYNINKYFPEALKLMYRCMTEQSLAIDKVLTGALPSDEANATMYHGILQMLQEYTQLLWLSKNSKKEMKAADDSYLELIDKAIEQVKTFPSGGNIYYSIIQTIIRLKPLGVPDEVAAERLNMSTYTFSIKKRRALLVLCSSIFCYEGDIFVKLLADKV